MIIMTVRQGLSGSLERVYEHSDRIIMTVSHPAALCHRWHRRSARGHFKLGLGPGQRTRTTPLAAHDDPSH